MNFMLQSKKLTHFNSKVVCLLVLAGGNSEDDHSSPFLIDHRTFLNINGVRW